VIPEDFRQLLPEHRASTEADDRPLAVLWVFNPATAHVHIESDEGDHPAHFPTHKEIAEKHGIHHPDKVQGYAYSIGGPGWRITDEFNHKVTDKYLEKAIQRALRKEHPAPLLPSIRHHGDPAPK
jgi:hypothetical protein